MFRFLFLLDSLFPAYRYLSEIFVTNEHVQIQPVTLNRSVEDATPLNPAAAPHVQSPYYGALAVTEFLGTSTTRLISEINFSSTPTLSGYALYTSTSSTTNSLSKILLINHDPFLSSQSTSSRPSLNVSLSSVGTRDVTLKKLLIPSVDGLTGLTWGGQSFDSGTASGSVVTTTQSTSDPIVIQSTQVILVQF